MHFLFNHLLNLKIVSIKFDVLSHNLLHPKLCQRNWIIRTRNTIAWCSNLA
jgi:hypothetical protein